MTNTVSTAEPGGATVPESEHESRSWRPAAILAMIAIAILVVATTAGSLRDLDVFWHIRLGEELLDGVSIYDAGSSWSYAPVADTWVSTQWVVEIIFALLDDVAGFNGLVGFRVATTALALVSVAVVLLADRNNRMWAVLITYLAAAFTLFVFAQDRPQQVSFILLPIAGWWWLRYARDGVAPRWWVVAPLCAVWANSHGLWIMVPTVLLLAILGRLIDQASPKRLRPGIWALLAALVGGSLTPVGPLNLLAPIRFAGTTSHIVEWDPTNFLSLVSLGFGLTLALFALAWARGRVRPPRSEVLFVLVLAVFGASAARNIAPAVLLLAPALAWRLSIAFRGPRSRKPSTAITQLAKPLGVFLAAFGILIGSIAIATSDPIPADSRPLGLVTRIADSPKPSRVLNGYNVSGLVLWFARPAVSNNEVRVGIDGRADRYGAAYIDEYLTMERAEPGWNETLKELDPTIALLPEDAALIPLLEANGWVDIGKEAGYVLLLPPGDGQ